MPHVLRPRRLGRKLDAVKRLGVPLRHATTPFVPRVEVTQLHPQCRGLKRVEPLVPSLDDVDAFSLLPEAAAEPDARCELLVVRRDSAAVSERAEVLARVEAECRKATERADSTAAV